MTAGPVPSLLQMTLNFQSSCAIPCHLDEKTTIQIYFTTGSQWASWFFFSPCQRICYLAQRARMYGTVKRIKPTVNIHFKRFIRCSELYLGVHLLTRAPICFTVLPSSEYETCPHNRPKCTHKYISSLKGTKSSSYCPLNN